MVGEILPLMSLHGMRNTTNPYCHSAGVGAVLFFSSLCLGVPAEPRQKKEGFRGGGSVCFMPRGTAPFFQGDVRSRMRRASAFPISNGGSGEQLGARLPSPCVPQTLKVIGLWACARSSHLRYPCHEQLGMAIAPCCATSWDSGMLRNF
jgi:hypothetical protein